MTQPNAVVEVATPGGRPVRIGQRERLSLIAGPCQMESRDHAMEMASAINDAPLDDLDYEDEVFTGARMRAYEVASAGRRERLYRLVARHRSTGDLAAQTVVAVEIDHPERGHQHDGVELPTRRGLERRDRPDREATREEVRDDDSPG